VKIAGLQIFELADDLASGGVASARLLRWNGLKYIPSDLIVLVHDRVGNHGIAHERGYCIFSAESESWEVVCGLQNQASAMFR
jgi:hypothetical protein